MYFSSFAYTPDEAASSMPLEQDPAVPPDVIANWQLSPSYPVRDFEAITTYPAVLEGDAVRSREAKRAGRC